MKRLRNEKLLLHLLNNGSNDGCNLANPRASATHIACAYELYPPPYILIKTLYSHHAYRATKNGFSITFLY